MKAVRVSWIGLVVVALANTLPVHAQPTGQPLTIFLERSEIIGIDNKIRALQVPTLDVDGTIRYFDLDIEIGLTINDIGEVSSTAIVTPLTSPTFLTNEFIPGTYDDGEGGTCTLGVSAASGGRTAGALGCRNSNGRAVFSANWITSPIADHPFETDLAAAGIDQNTGAENVAWGKGSGTSAGFVYRCFSSGGNIISAHQAGNVLAVNNFASDDKIDCSYSFILVQ